MTRDCRASLHPDAHWRPTRTHRDVTSSITRWRHTTTQRWRRLMNVATSSDARHRYRFTHVRWRHQTTSLISVKSCVFVLCTSTAKVIRRKQQQKRQDFYIGEYWVRCRQISKKSQMKNESSGTCFLCYATKIIFYNWSKSQLFEVWISEEEATLHNHNTQFPRRICEWNQLENSLNLTSLISNDDNTECY